MTQLDSPKDTIGLVAYVDRTQDRIEYAVGNGN